MRGFRIFTFIYKISPSLLWGCTVWIPTIAFRFRILKKLTLILWVVSRCYWNIFFQLLNIGQEVTFITKKTFRNKKIVKMQKELLVISDTWDVLTHFEENDGITLGVWTVILLCLYHQLREFAFVSYCQHTWPVYLL